MTLLTLGGLERRDTAAMIANVAGSVTLPHDIMEEIAERTDGVPLFVEELTKAVLESGAHGAAALSSVPPRARSVPATLHASLVARLDRLGLAAREVAQTGAAIGREFGFGLLACTTDLPEPQLHAALDRLTNAGLLFASGTPPASGRYGKLVSRVRPVTAGTDGSRLGAGYEGFGRLPCYRSASIRAEVPRIARGMPSKARGANFGAEMSSRGVAADWGDTNRLGSSRDVL